MLVALCVFVIGAPVAIVQRIRRWRWRRAHPDAPGLPADQVALKRAFLGSLGSVLSFSVFVGSMSLYTLAYMEANDTDVVEGYRLGLPAMVASPALLLCASFWDTGRSGIFNLLRQRTALKKSPKAIISYVLEMIVPLYFLQILVRMMIEYW